MRKIIALISLSLIFAACEKKEENFEGASADENVIEDLAAAVVEETVLTSDLETTDAILQESSTIESVLINTDTIDAIASYLQQKFASGDLDWFTSNVGGDSTLANLAARRINGMMSNGQFNSFVNQRRGRVANRSGARMHKRGFHHGQQQYRNGFASQNVASRGARFARMNEEMCMTREVIEGLSTSADLDSNGSLATAELATFRTALEATAQQCAEMHRANQEAARAARLAANGAELSDAMRRLRPEAAQARIYSKVRHQLMTVHSVLTDKVEAEELSAFMTTLRQEVVAKMEARRAEIMAELAAETL
jgi:hypothetical protein